MKRKFFKLTTSIKITSILLALTCFIGGTGFAFGTETANITTFASSKEVAYIEANLSDPNTYSAKLELLLNDPAIDEIVVLDDMETTNMNLSIPPIEKLPPPGFIYRITGVTGGGTSTGTTLIAIATGTPGITLTINETKSVSHSFSCTISAVSTSKITAAVGFSVTGSTSISISGSAKVPSTHNGKKVKTMTLNAYPAYDVKKFNVERQHVIAGTPSGPWTNVGTGSAKQAKGVSFTKTYKYK